MKTPIVAIERADEKTIEFLLKVGILEVTEEGLKVREER